MNRLFISPDVLDPAAGGRNFLVASMRKVISNFILKILELDIRITNKYGVRVGFLTNSYLYNKLLPYSGTVSLIDYTAALIDSVEKEDFTFLHAMADRIEELSLLNNIFAYKDVSLAKVHEIRWIWPIAHSLGFANLIDELIDEKKFNSLSSYGFNKFLPSSLLAAKKNNITITLSAKLFALMSAYLECWKHEHFLSRMFNHYLGRKGNYSSVEMVINNYFKYNNNSYYLNKMKIKSGNKLILVVINFDRTLERFEQLLPIFNELGYSIHVLALPRVKGIHRLTSAGIECTYVSDWYSSSEFGELFKAKQYDIQKFITILDDDEQLNSILSKKINLYQISKPALLSYIKYGFKGALLSAYVSDKCIEALDPHLILGFEDWDFNRSCNLIGRKKSIPSLGYYVLSAPALPKLVRRTHDYLAVSGINLKNAFNNQYPDDKIIITGDPLSGNTSESRLDKKNKINLSQHGLEKKKYIILLLLTYPYDGFSLSQIKLYVTRTFYISKKITESAVVIKAHPAQSVSEIVEWLKNWGCPSVPIFQNESLQSLCDIANIASAPITSAVFQVMSSGVPVVSLQDAESLKPFDGMGYDYLQNKGVKHIPQSQNDHDDFIKLMLPGDEREEQIKRGYLHANEHTEVFTDEMKIKLKDFIISIENMKKI